MAIDLSERLLAALRCPESGQKLGIASADLIQSVNERISAGALRNRAGKSVDTAIPGGLLREDGALLYPVIDGFPVLLIDEAIEVGGDEASEPSRRDARR